MQGTIENHFFKPSCPNRVFSEKKIQMRRTEQALFQIRRSLTPRPPWSFVNVTVSQATLAEWWPSRFPFQMKNLHIELIFLIQALGRINAQHQNVVIPAMIVLIRSRRPANDRVLTAQEDRWFFTWWSSGSQFANESFLEFSGTPRYLKESVPLTIPVEAWIVFISCSDNPEA